MKATGIVRRIDELGRIVIPKEIRRTLRIREGDSLEIYTDKEGGVILKKYSPIGELGDFAREYAESIQQTAGCIVIITDNDSIVAVSGIKRGININFPLKVNKGVNEVVEQMISERTRINVSSSHGEGMFRITADDEELKYTAELLVPIISMGDAIGSVIFVSFENGATFGQTELKLAETAANFMGKQLEN